MNMSGNPEKKSALPYIMLHLLLLVYSCCGILSKTAASKDFLSVEWCFFYGIMIFLMGIYAILWQQILKKLPLNVAFSNKAVTLIWSMLWGVIFFKETLSITNIIGAVIVLAGVILMVSGEGEKNE